MAFIGGLFLGIMIGSGFMLWLNVRFPEKLDDASDKVKKAVEEIKDNGDDSGV